MNNIEMVELTNSELEATNGGNVWTALVTALVNVINDMNKNPDHYGWLFDDINAGAYPYGTSADSLAMLVN